MSVNKTISVKNIDIGGDHSKALENKDVLWNVGDRMCTKGPTKDREKSFFHTNYGGTDLMISLVIDQGHNVVIFEHNDSYELEPPPTSIYLNENKFLLFHYWSGTADQSCNFLHMNEVENRFIASKLEYNYDSNNMIEVPDEKIMVHSSPIESFTWIYTCKGFHQFMKDRLVDAYPSL